jgi:hypothetical protein
MLGRIEGSLRQQDVIEQDPGICPRQADGVLKEAAVVGLREHAVDEDTGVRDGHDIPFFVRLQC